MFIFDHLGKTKKIDLHALTQRVYASQGDQSDNSNRSNNQIIQGYLVRKNWIEGWNGNRGEYFSPHHFFEKVYKQKYIPKLFYSQEVQI